MTIGQALVEPLSRPRLLLETWNWKTALMSSGVRAIIFFTINLSAGFGAALAALQTELIYRAIASGFYGGWTERLSRATPPRAAIVTALVILPAVAHAIEFVVHATAGTAVLGASIAGSIAFSVLSTRFNLFAMQRGVLTIGPGRRSIGADLREMPVVVAGFVWSGIGPIVRAVPLRDGRSGPSSRAA